MDGEPITIRKLRERFGGEVLDVQRRPGDDAVTLKRGRIPDIARFLRDDPELRYGYLMDICGVDYLDLEIQPRFAVIYHLYSLEHGHRIRLKVPLDETDAELDSVVPVWDGANWFEREAFDMFGIKFRGHPFLRRILTHHQFVGHPLRKDYDHGKRQLCTEVWDLEFE
ncbi:MAG: NADH-quinone oxidoreductase subunit C [Deltaproteobacteria bacterium]|nr:NADH-quinone oxidoreductase subunit C [Deltaproteobacteria bacterium]